MTVSITIINPIASREVYLQIAATRRKELSEPGVAVAPGPGASTFPGLWAGGSQEGGSF